MLVVGHLVVANLGPCNKTGRAKAKCGKILLIAQVQNWDLASGFWTRAFRSDYDFIFYENPIDCNSVCLFIVN